MEIENGPDIKAENPDAESGSSQEKKPVSQAIKDRVRNILNEVPFIGKPGGGDGIHPIEIDEEEGSVFILETKLPINQEGGPHVPRPEKFTHFALDERTLKVMESVATAAELGDPCLLEGETSTSKTSSIEYVAMLTNNPTIRFNMNGQTDTSEFIGRYVPNDGSSQIDFEEMLRDPSKLTGEAQRIVSEARGEGRSLTLEESQMIAKIEKVPVSEWRWQDGIIPIALEKGYWVILDELNLGEPQILERINSVLERHPSLTVSEHEGEKIGSGSDRVVHPNFRIFATMNPADYSGRSVLSPAYKDRWINQVSVSQPTAEEYRQMLKLLVYGKQPDLEVRDQKYTGVETQPFFENLENVKGIENVIVRVSKFQEELEELAKNKDIGRGRKEGYVFTRRGLIEFMEYLDRKTIVDRRTGEEVTILDDPEKIILRGLEYSFTEKFSDPDDLQKVMDLLAALKLTEDTLSLRQKIGEDLEVETPSQPEILFVNGYEVRTTGEKEVNGIKIGDKYSCMGTSYEVRGFINQSELVYADSYGDLAIDNLDHAKKHILDGGHR